MSFEFEYLGIFEIYTLNQFRVLIRGQAGTCDEKIKGKKSYVRVPLTKFGVEINSP
jgi:hypothetical protein